jgi:hypothetical protein
MEENGLQSPLNRADPPELQSIVRHRQSVAPRVFDRRAVIKLNGGSDDGRGPQWANREKFTGVLSHKTNPVARHGLEVMAAKDGREPVKTMFLSTRPTSTAEEPTAVR